jgi:sulfur relay (sulfurtransferase) DsrC/TusE family protein
MKKFKNLGEAKEKSVVFSFGRFNPPTTGHEKLLKAASKIATAQGADLKVYPSQSQDPKKNPLSFTDKVKFMRKMFRTYAKSISSDKTIKTSFDVIVKLYDQGYTDVTMVVGGDRVAEFDKLLNKYNGVKGRHGFYEFEGGVKIKSAGNRADPDSDAAKTMSADAMSASVLRKLASEGDFEEFKKGVPDTLGDKDKRVLFNKIRTGMKLAAINEMFELLFGEALLNEEEMISEKAPPDAEIEKWLEKPETKAEFKDRYGNDWEKVMYATAWKMHKDKSKEEEWNIDEELDEEYAPADINDLFEEEFKDYRSLSFDLLREKVVVTEEGEITKAHLNAIEKYADKLFNKVGIDVEFTRHFLDRVNDARNKKQITNAELVRLFKQTYAKYGKKIAKLGPDAEAVLNDIRTDVNMPFVLKWDAKNNELDMVAKTVMRKKDFKTPDQKLVIDGVAQDKDIEDREGSQPKKYYAGDMSKSTKEKRAAHFAKGKSGPAPGDASAKTKPSKHTKKYQQMFGEVAELFDELDEAKIKGLVDKAEKTGISYGILKKVYDRGMAAFKTGHRPGATAQQWAFARVNSFVTKGKGTWGKADADLAAKVRGEEVEGVNKKTVKTIREAHIAEVTSNDLPDMGDEDPYKDVQVRFVPYAVKIKGFPEFYLYSVSVSKVRSAIRMTLKRMDDIEYIERVTDAEVRGEYRQRAYDPGKLQAKDDNLKVRQDAYYRESYGYGSDELVKAYKKTTPGELEEATPRWIKELIAKYFAKNKYEKAAQGLLRYVDKMEKEKPGRHGLDFYAGEILRFTNSKMDAKILAKTARKILATEAIFYAKDNNLSLHEIYRPHSDMYYQIFETARELDAQVDGTDKYLLEQTNIGEWERYDGEFVPLDIPLVENWIDEEKDVELGKPKRGGSKKFYVYVKNDKGNVIKVSFGDTSGLKAKINNKDAAKSFAARHQCDTKKDRTTPGYWACRLPMYAKELGLEGGGDYFW